MLSILSALSLCLALVSATPTLVPKPQVQRRSTSGGVRVIYTDDTIGSTENTAYQGLPSATSLEGWSHLILSFILVNGPADQCEQWKELSASTRKQLLDEYHDAGITLMASALGSTEIPTTKGVDAKSLATSHANYIKTYNLEGIDVDYEDMGAMNRQDGSAEKWLVTYTQTLRNLLPAGQYLITHAPVAPWFSSSYKSGAYITVNKEAGDDIDWYNIQFYNQGDDEYTTCENLIHTSGGDFPGTALLEINSKAGVAISKLVLGKPSAAYQADNGWVDFATLAQCIAEAGEKGWDAGVMFWEAEDSLKVNALAAPFKALAAIGGNNIPIASATKSHSITLPTPTTSTKNKASAPSTSAPAATSTTPAAPPQNPESDPSPSSNNGGCSGVPAWDSDKVYNGGTDVSGSGTTVSYNGHKYQNKWWSQNDKPDTEGDSSPWANLGSCSSSKRGEATSEFVAKRAAEYKSNVTHARRGSHEARRKRSHLARLNELS